MPPRAGSRRAETLRRLLLVVVTDRRRCRGELLASCEAAVRGGATAVLLRDKDLPRARRRALAKRLRSITARYNAALLVHSDAALAREVDADGVHLDSKAGPREVAAARRVLGRGRVVGVSAHSEEEARRAACARADYAFLGPVFRSRSHGRARGMGPRAFSGIQRVARLPVVAIGGMNSLTIAILRHGTPLCRAAAIDGLLAVRDPASEAGTMLRLGHRDPAAREGKPFERVLLERVLARTRRPGVLLLGPGDDAAVLRTRGAPLAVATDLTIEGIHYAPGTRPREIGFKAAARALSDLAAVGAKPVGLMVGMSIRRGFRSADVLAREIGALDAGRACGAPILGGDTKETPATETMSVTALGSVEGPPALARSGGRPGDALFVTGPLGGSIHGRHLHPSPRIREGLALRRGRLATACIDISDGLATDLHRLCRASKAGALLESWRVPIHRDARRGRAKDPLSRALFDGEDYELLFAVPPGKAALVERRGVAGTRVHRVGRLVHERAGVVVQGEDGIVRPLADEGWTHFRERTR